MHALKYRATLWIVAAVVGVLFCGCGARRTMVILVPDRDGHVGLAEVVTDGGNQLLDAAGQAAVVKNRRLAPEHIAVVDETRINTLFAQAMAALPPEPEKFYLYFQTGTTQLDGESLLLLSEVLASIHRRHSNDISVNGHTDRLGPSAFNQDLSLQRALRIQALLIKAGVNPNFLSIASHGEGNPIVPTPDNVAEPRNRCVEVIIR